MRMVSEFTMTDEIYNNILDCARGKITRLIPQEGRYELAHGIDHACGCFIQFFPLNKETENYCKKSFPNFDECIDIDACFNGLTNTEYHGIIDSINGDLFYHL